MCQEFDWINISLHFCSVPHPPKTVFCCWSSWMWWAVFGLPEEEEMIARNVCGPGPKWIARMGFGPLVEALADTHTVSFSPLHREYRSHCCHAGHLRHLTQHLTTEGKERTSYQINNQRQYRWQVLSFHTWTNSTLSWKIRLFIHCWLVRCSNSFNLSFSSGTKLVTALKLEVTKATSAAYGLISKFIGIESAVFLLCGWKPRGGRDSCVWQNWCPCVWIMYCHRESCLTRRLGVSSTLGQVSSSLLLTNTGGGTEGHSHSHTPCKLWFIKSKLPKMGKDNQTVKLE